MRHSRLLLALLIAPFAACDDEDTNGPPVSDVTTSGLTFTPPALVLGANDSIAVWYVTNGPHNITWEDAAPPSGDLVTGTYQREFVGANNSTYRYRCTIHSTDFNTGMVGSVFVP